MFGLEAWIGIDPGLTGAAALIDEKDNLQLFDWPGVAVAWDCIREWSGRFRIQAAVLERIDPHPVDGRRLDIVGIGKLIHNAGQWDGILVAAGVPYLRRTPQQWQKGLIQKHSGPTTKKRALAAARKLYPNCKLISQAKHHNRADAILIAKHAQGYTPERIKLIKEMES